MAAFRAMLQGAVVGAVMLFASCSSEPPAPPKVPAKVIKGGTLIDGTGRPPIPNSVVVIELGKVVAAGSSADIKIPEGSAATNATGLFITPTQTGAHIAYGAPANLYLLNGNPIENPMVLMNPLRVMRAGEWSDGNRK